jgi:excisionase family DNA binding protein
MPMFNVRMKHAPARPHDAHEPITLLTPAETGDRLGNASEMHVYRLIADGVLRAVDIARPGAKRSKTRIRSDDLADYIERSTRGRGSTATA